MDRENRLYYSALVFLEWVISGFDYLMDAISSTELQNRYQQGHVRFNQLAGWLTDEVFSAGDRNDIDEEQASAIYSKMEDLEPTILSWADKVQTAAYNEAAKGDAARKDDIACFFGCMWVLRILNAFDQMLAGLTSQTLNKRYQNGRSKVYELAEWLEGELSWFNQQNGFIEEDARLVHAEGEALVERLTAEWHDSVHAFARQVDADQ